ncbi:MAG TPA: hypothetical protein VI277_05015, partial [Candidatus Limnocylindria bacterium]
MLARTDSRARALVLLIVACVVASAVGARLVWWQVVQQGELAGMALHQLAQHQQLPAERGDITDATGTLLAASVEVQSVFATPPMVDNPAMAARMLAPVLGMDVDVIRHRLESDQPWVWLKRRVEPAEAEAVTQLGFRGISMLPETRRVYPIEGVASDTTLAAQVIGFVDVDGNGRYGIEAGEDGLLAGTPGLVSAQEDVVGRRIAESASVLQEPIDGSDLSLTIDAGVQDLLERELWRTFNRNHAVGATGLIMDAETGAILAMASYPSYDANRFATTEGEL